MCKTCRIYRPVPAVLVLSGKDAVRIIIMHSHAPHIQNQFFTGRQRHCGSDTVRRRDGRQFRDSRYQAKNKMAHLVLRSTPTPFAFAHHGQWQGRKCNFPPRCRHTPSGRLVSTSPTPRNRMESRKWPAYRSAGIY